MTEPSWKPLFRSPKSTVTKVLGSPAFISSREQAGAIIDNAAALRTLAGAVQTLQYADAPLSAVADRVAAAVRLLRARADRLDSAGSPDVDSAEVTSSPEGAQPAASSVARVRLVVAALHYLVTPVDLVPDFRSGGYIDDALLLSWVFGAAADELEPFLDHGEG